MGDLFNFLNDRFSALIQALKSTQQGYNESTHEYGGGGIDNISDKTDTIKSNTDSLKTDVESIKSDVGSIKTSNSNIKSNTDTIKTNTNTIKTDIDAIKTSLANVYTLLGSTRVIISRADYDALAVKDPNTIYYIKEPETVQPEPSNP